MPDVESPTRLKGKTENPSLPDNKQSAVHRLNSLERCLRRDEHYRNDYIYFMNEIITRGDAESVPPDELENQPTWICSSISTSRKQILQELCRDKVNWDEELPGPILSQWQSWLQDLPHLADLKIPRSNLPSQFDEVSLYELHNFSDVSCSGYSACSYHKLTTIPRLELSSAVTSVRIGDVLKRELEIEHLQEYYWTDSKVVLGYVNNDAKRFHTFVANRIQHIRSSTIPEQWLHVSSATNPAYHASRGLSAVQLKESNWLKGPDFLWQRNFRLLS
ncbi:hypothetical protein QQF64_013402 [Cirrhinus molitorella]|uniref:Uncharacterized protein n=1 Tax=Cirrhinus molitorella TaxID=172907 RepID=A0ABR3LTP3_9TELE